MSRNRTTIKCDCGLWSFQTERRLPQDAPGLLRIQEYFHVIGRSIWDDNSGRGWGYGFNSHLDGDPAFAYVDPEKRYRWRKVECPFCRVVYAGWYCAETCLRAETPWSYVLYDTSYWSTFDDEPGPADLAMRGTVTAQDLIDAWRSYRPAHPVPQLRRGMLTDLRRVFAEARSMCGSLPPDEIDDAQEQVDELREELFGILCSLKRPT